MNQSMAEMCNVDVAVYIKQTVKHEKFDRTQ